MAEDSAEELPILETEKPESTPFVSYLEAKDRADKTLDSVIGSFQEWLDNNPSYDPSLTDKEREDGKIGKSVIFDYHDPKSGEKVISLNKARYGGYRIIIADSDKDLLDSQSGRNTQGEYAIYFIDKVYEDYRAVGYSKSLSNGMSLQAAGNSYGYISGFSDGLRNYGRDGEPKADPLIEGGRILETLKQSQFRTITFD